jgi:hypothetical protein
MLMELRVLNMSRWYLLLALVLVLAGCGSQKSEPVQAVENYYQAITTRDEDLFINSTCADWEEQGRVEFDSFQGVTSTLEDFSCQETGKEGDAALVTCTGKIAASYENEKLDFPLADRVHTVKNEAGDWRVCGY